MRDKEYRSIDRLSYSSLKDLFVSFELFEYKRTHKTEPTKDMVFGTALHHMVLGTEQHVRTLPEGSANSKKYKDALEDLKRNADEDDVFVTSEEYEILKIMQKRAFEHPIAGQILTGGESEVPLFFSVNGVDFKAKPDKINGCIADPKTWSPGYRQDINKFFYTIKDSMYHLQAACYIEAALQNGYQPMPFYNIVFLKAPPYLIYVVEIPKKLLIEGRQLMFDGAELYKEAQARHFKDKHLIINFD